MGLLFPTNVYPQGVSWLLVFNSQFMDISTEGCLIFFIFSSTLNYRDCNHKHNGGSEKWRVKKDKSMKVGAKWSISFSKNFYENPKYIIKQCYDILDTPKSNWGWVIYLFIFLAEHNNTQIKSSLYFLKKENRYYLQFFYEKQYLKNIFVNLCSQTCICISLGYI